MRRNSGLLISICVLAVLLLSGSAYAAGTNTITLTGLAARTKFLNLEFSNLSIENPRPGESVNFMDVNNKSMHFNVQLIEAGDVRRVSFSLANKGNLSIRIIEIVSFNHEAEFGVLVLWPALENLVVHPGQIAGPYTINVSWNIEAQDVQSGSAHIEAYINYIQT